MAVSDMSHDAEGLPADIKKVRLLDLAMIVLGGMKGINEKMMLFDLTEKEKKHITMMVANGQLDIHETIDDKNNEHKSIARIDLSAFQNLPSPAVTRDELIEKAGLEEVTIEAEENRDLTAFAPDERFENLTLKNRELHITRETIWPVCKLSEVREHDYRYVQVFDGNEYKFTLMKMNNKYYKITDESAAKMLEVAVPGIVKILEESIIMAEDQPAKSS